MVLDEIISYKDNPVEDVYDKFEGMLFEGHPLGGPILGTTASVKRITPEDLRRFVRTFFTPDRMAFTVVADIDEKVLEKAGPAPGLKSCSARQDSSPISPALRTQLGRECSRRKGYALPHLPRLPFPPSTKPWTNATTR